MGQLSAELGSIRQLIESRDELDAERRKVDDARNLSAERGRQQLLDRVDGHGKRLGTLETNWATFFSEIGAFTYVKKKVESAEKQNRAIIGLLLTTLAGVIVSLLKR